MPRRGGKAGLNASLSKSGTVVTAQRGGGAEKSNKKAGESRSPETLEGRKLPSVTDPTHFKPTLFLVHRWEVCTSALWGYLWEKESFGAVYKSIMPVLERQTVR